MRRERTTALINRRSSSRLVPSLLIKKDQGPRLPDRPRLRQLLLYQYTAVEVKYDREHKRVVSNGSKAGSDAHGIFRDQYLLHQSQVSYSHIKCPRAYHAIALWVLQWHKKPTDRHGTLSIVDYIYYEILSYTVTSRNAGVTPYVSASVSRHD